MKFAVLFTTASLIYYKRVEERNTNREKTNNYNTKKLFINRNVNK